MAIGWKVNYKFVTGLEVENIVKYYLKTGVSIIPESVKLDI